MLLIHTSLVNISVLSQTAGDIQALKNVFETNDQKTNYKELIKDNHNEFQLLASGLFLFYKSFISSQDGNHCIFNPSCSVYAIQSIKKNGLLIGISDGIDRLTRCNRLSLENYQKFENTNLYSDPVYDSNEK